MQSWVRIVWILLWILNISFSYSSSLWNIYDYKSTPLFDGLYVFIGRFMFNLQASWLILSSNLTQISSNSKQRKAKSGLDSLNNPLDSSKKKMDTKSKKPKEERLKSQSINISTLTARLVKPIYFSHVIVLKWYFFSLRHPKSQNLFNWVS